MHDESYWHVLQMLESNCKYSGIVHRQLKTEIELLKAVTDRDLDFGYELKLSRALRKMRRKLGYDR